VSDDLLRFDNATDVRGRSTMWKKAMDQYTSVQVSPKVSQPLAFSFRFDRDRGKSLVRQIAARVQAEIEGGRLRPGAHLPSLREMARLVGVSTFTVFAAYDLLASLHYVSPGQGAGYIVSQRGKRDILWPEF
jgi:Bacterial regulatory proteins, gntR family